MAAKESAAGASLTYIILTILRYTDAISPLCQQGDLFEEDWFLIATLISTFRNKVAAPSKPGGRLQRYGLRSGDRGEDVGQKERHGENN